jgi:hypothetical protein
MALARIITHSNLCARELAFHLLGRGYAVEIVSPDSVPNNFADLELRVDAQSGDQLVASLTAHEGQRIAALDFVHRVKLPMEEVMLTMPVFSDTQPVENPVVINVAPSIAEMEAGADSSYPAPHYVSPFEETGPDLEFRTNLPSDKAAHLSPPQDPSEDPSEGQLPLSPSATAELESTLAEAMPAAITSREIPDEPLSYFARQTSSIALPFAGPAVVLPTWKPQIVDRTVGRKSVLPAALTLAAIVLLALFLAFAVRQTAKASDGSFTTASTPAIPGSASTPNSGMSEKVATVDTPSTNRPVAGRPKGSTRHEADLIAPNTVVYLDSRYKPLSKPQTKRPKQKAKQR